MKNDSVDYVLSVLQTSHQTFLVFQDVYKTFSRRLQDVFQDVFKTSSRRLQDVFARSLAIMSSRRLQDVL